MLSSRSVSDVITARMGQTACRSICNRSYSHFRVPQMYTQPMFMGAQPPVEACAADVFASVRAYSDIVHPMFMVFRGPEVR